MRVAAKVLVGLFCAISAASARSATQGTASTTSSTASFSATAQGPAPARQVQILNVSDVTITNSTRPDTSASNVGVSMPFCIVDTYQGAVLLTMTTSRALGPSNRWQMQSADNSTVPYTLGLTYADLSGSFTAGGTLTNVAVSNSIPAAKAVASTGACGSGNFKVHFTIYGASGGSPAPLPESLPAKSYTDTITMTVAPQ